MLNETLCNPLAASHVESMVGATKAGQSVILNCWPRMVFHRGSVLKGLTFGWVAIDGREGQDVDGLREEMKEAVQMLKCVVEKEVEWDEEVRVLVEAEPRLQGLFDVRAGGVKQTGV